MPHDVIMPALGMTQDSGLIVAWHKKPGDAVAVGDVLFEVETDKATMEVEAAHDGFIEALLAGEGEDAPVGQVIAVISDSKPDNPTQSRLVKKPEASEPAAAPSEEVTSPGDDAPKPTPKPMPVDLRTDGRILASPKARRLALEQGLDLADLAADGVPQPYHASDIETLKARPAKATTLNTAAISQLTARVSQDGFTAFQSWLTETAAVPVETIWASFAAASLRAASKAETVNIRVDQPTLRISSFFADPDLGSLSHALPGDALQVSLILRDLTSSRITGGSSGAEDAPVLTICRDGDNFALTLTYALDLADIDTAIRLLDGFAARLDEPLRHLL